MKRLLRSACLLLAACLAPSAFAQTWPSKPIRLVLQFPPGGSTDSVARILAQSMSATLGQPVLVENRPAADGAIAGDFVARAEPDGHTFFLASNTPMMQVPLLKKNPPYDPVKSFAPAKVAPEIVQRLNRELNAAMQRPDVRERISALGFELVGSSPDEMAVFLQEQLLAWGKAFRDAGMTPE